MRVEPRGRRAYPWYLRLLYRAQERRFGAPLAAATIWGRIPRLLATFTALYKTVDRTGSPIEPALRSLVMVRISQINDCPFCIDLNMSILAQRGVSDEKILAISDWRTSDAFDAREQVALAYAEAVTVTDHRVDAPLAAQLKSHFDDDALVELTALIAFQNMSSKFNNALDIPPQGICRLSAEPGVRQSPVEKV